jgi:hypothetical protein
MKVPLVYPKIPENTNGFLNKCIAFEKYDGSNLHWTWNACDGWRFGTRRTQFILNRKGIAEFTAEHSELASAPHIFNDLVRDKLTIFCNTYHYWNKEFTIFTEFYGPNSFAGGHSKQDMLDDTQELILIDAAFDNNILPPEDFLKYFQGNFTTAKVIYTGKYTGQFTEDVRKGKYNLNEGVVCKGMVDGQLFMTKVKTNDYLKRLSKR